MEFVKNNTENCAVCYSKYYVLKFECNHHLCVNCLHKIVNDYNDYEIEYKCVLCRKEHLITNEIVNCCYRFVFLWRRFLYLEVLYNYELNEDFKKNMDEYSNKGKKQVSALKKLIKILDNINCERFKNEE